MKKIMFLIPLLMAGVAVGQIGGNQAFQFLNLPTSARQAALGGKLIPILDQDLGPGLSNPALLSGQSSNQLLLTYQSLFAGIKAGHFAYARDVKNSGTWAISLSNINYGNFMEANELGDITGSFGASELAWGLSWSKALDSSFRVGASLRYIQSKLAEYQSNALASDLGISYSSPSRLFTATLVARHMGRQLDTYYAGGSRENLPFEIEAGISKRLSHAPFRFSLIIQQLQKWELAFTNPVQEGENTLTGESPASPGVLENAWRHVVLGAEFIPSGNFALNMGYNSQKRQELKVSTRPGLAGFSMGFSLRISKFRFGYGRTIYSLAGASNLFTVNMVFPDRKKS